MSKRAAVWRYVDPLVSTAGMSRRDEDVAVARLAIVLGERDDGSLTEHEKSACDDLAALIRLADRKATLDMAARVHRMLRP